MNAQEVLRHYFGHESFRNGQETMINALLHGRDALGIMPTGAGKSLCYQVPALMLPGITLVISPLISLMADQVAALKSAGVPAAYLNSSLTPRQMDLAMERARNGAYKIIYVAPERLETSSFQAMAQAVQISMLAVDEAHCVSQWGQDFRPVYLRIADFLDALPRRPVVGAFTATATARVREDIIKLLRLRMPEMTTTGFDRPNLYFEVIQPKKRDAALVSIVKQKKGMCGIVYCATRKAVEQTCDLLIKSGVSATRYHAGLSDEERKQNQESFQYDNAEVMVATNAFGMGIDKSNVRYVVHYQMPRSMEAYYQEAGRAGRDGEKSECILLYSPADIYTAKWMIENGEPNEQLSAAEQAQVRAQDKQRLNQMVNYCTKATCLRSYILRYFGEQGMEHCNDCSACNGPRYGSAAELTRTQTRRPVSALPSTPVVTTPLAPGEKIAAPKGGDLFEQLRTVRMRLAKQAKLPPYIICNDATLTAMVRRKPQTLEGIRTIPGMGEVKTAKYGQAFLEVLRPYAQQERRMKADIKALAERAQSAAFRNKPVSSVPSRPKVQTPPKAPTHSYVVEHASAVAKPVDIDWDNLKDDEVLADAYLSGVSIQQMSARSGCSQEWLRERLRNMDLIF